MTQVIGGQASQIANLNSNARARHCMRVTPSATIRPHDVVVPLVHLTDVFLPSILPWFQLELGRVLLVRWNCNRAHPSELPSVHLSPSC